jgi:hypothetical protein
MHPRLKQTNKLRQSYDEEENHGGIEQAGSTRQGKDAGSEASSTFNSCIIWVASTTLSDKVAALSDGSCSRSDAKTKVINIAFAPLRHSAGSRARLSPVAQSCPLRIPSFLRFSAFRNLVIPRARGSDRRFIHLHRDPRQLLLHFGIAMRRRAQGKILRLQRQPDSEPRPQGMKEDAQDCFHGMARLPAEGANRNDFNAVGIIDMHDSS